MRSSGGKRLTNPKKVLCCNVSFLDDAVATYEIPKDAKGKNVQCALSSVAIYELHFLYL